MKRQYRQIAIVISFAYIILGCTFAAQAATNTQTWTSESSFPAQSILASSTATGTVSKTGTEAEKFYPRGERFCFSFYSTSDKDSAYVLERGATAIGPYYGSQTQPLALARAMKAPIIYYVLPACMKDRDWDKDPPPNKSEVIEQVAQIVDAVKDEPLIIMWAVGPAELRFWKKYELQYLEWITSTIRKFDPQHRPVFMYEPNARSADALQKTLVFQDVCAKGMYVDFMGFRHNRIWARWSMDQVMEAASTARSRQVLPWTVLQMSSDAPPNDRNQIEAQCRHDAYLALVMGAKGILVWSGARGRERLKQDFQAYLDSYLSVATDLNGPMGLASIFLKGSELRAVRMDVKEGPRWLDLKYGDGYRYRPVTWTTRELDGKLYLFVVNSAETDVQVTFTGLPLLPWESLFEKGVQGKGNGQLEVGLPPLGVKAYRFSSPTLSATRRP